MCRRIMEMLWLAEKKNIFLRIRITILFLHEPEFQTWTMDRLSECNTSSLFLHTSPHVLIATQTANNSLMLMCVSDNN